MTTKERQTMLNRFADTDRWLARVYDPNRSPEHRTGMWNFLMQTANPRFRQLLINTRTLDEQCVQFWDHYKN